jgi:hypothetical protein
MLNKIASKYLAKLASKAYDKPYTYNEVAELYGSELADTLYADPCHRWRMETGIELVHKEPTLEEQNRIWKNWQLMSDEDKQRSDEKCMELFGMTNEELNTMITAEQLAK